MSSTTITPSPSLPYASALLYILDLLTVQVTRLDELHKATYTEFLTSEQIASIQALPGIITTLREVAQYGPYPWMQTVVDKLQITVMGLRGKIEELEKELVEVGGVDEEDVARRALGVGREMNDGEKKKDDSDEEGGEWIVVDDKAESEKKDRGESEEEKETESDEERYQRFEKLSDRHACLVVLCDALSILTPLIPIPHTTFRKPVVITDFRGNKFPFPSEYSIAELHAILKVRYATGSGSKFIQNGRYELLYANKWDTPVQEGDSLEAGKRLDVALILQETEEETHLCPIPTCRSDNLMINPSKGRSCLDCGVWVYHATQPRSGTPEEFVASSKNSFPELPYKSVEAAILDKKSHELKGVKSIKTYPLTNSLPTTDSDARVFLCKSPNCNTHIVKLSDVISKNFRGQHGQAYLFTTITNVTRGPTVERTMTTGKHSICDIYCRKCGVDVGWMYERAELASEEYKIGKFLVEMERLCGFDEVVREKKVSEEEKGKGKGKEKEKEAGWDSKGLDLLSRVRTVKGELLGLEDLEQRLKALLDEENGVNRDRRDEEEED